jgi:hypothetical protein
VFGNLAPKLIWYTLGEGCPETTKGAKVPREELGVKGIPGKVHRGNADKVTDLKGGLAMHGRSMTLGTLNSISRADRCGHVEDEGNTCIASGNAGQNAGSAMAQENILTRERDKVADTQFIHRHDQLLGQPS